VAKPYPAIQVQAKTGRAVIVEWALHHALRSAKRDSWKPILKILADRVGGEVSHQ
jgi:hypothetical protein